MSTLKTIRMIGLDDLDDIATGGAILGTGGGGDPYIGKLMAQEAIRTPWPGHARRRRRASPTTR